MIFKLIFSMLCLGATLPLLAQVPVPSTAQMIEQLKAPRTRSLRNLTVEAVTAKAAPDGAEALNPAPETPVTAARPSLSLLIQFDFNSARVRPESQQALAQLSQALLSPELRDSRFAVEGHTDAQGRADVNLKLSQQRALAVRDFLKTQGVVADRLATVGKGASELANPADPQSGENRRVRIVNLD